MTGLPVLEDLGDIDSARVLVRLDLNVPMAKGPDGERHITDDFRIRAALPTLQWLMSHGAQVTVCTHLGRPKAGEVDPAYTVEPVRAALDEMIPGLKLLENLRFAVGEKANDATFVAELIDGQDFFVNDAFGVCHRADASVVGPPAHLPSAAGRLVASEVEQLGGLLDDPARPFVVVVGGAKVADKIGLLAVLARKADRVLIGGGMAFTFTKALGESVGTSLLDDDRVEECRQMLADNASLMLPVDFVAAAPGVELQIGTAAAPAPAAGDSAASSGSSRAGGSNAPDEVQVVGRSVPDGWTGFDIGPASAELFREVIAGAATVLWNGPMGVFEDQRFAEGTRKVTEAVAASGARTVVGGGDSVAALNKYRLGDRVDHISTGGGASLEFLEHGDLPGLAALRQAGARMRAARMVRGT